MRQKPGYIAEVTYRSTKQGRQTTNAFSGYRPYIKFADRNELSSGEQIFIGQNSVAPAETAKAQITIVGTEIFKNSLFVGQDVSIWQNTASNWNRTNFRNNYLCKKACRYEYCETQTTLCRFVFNSF